MIKAKVRDSSPSISQRLRSASGNKKDPATSLFLSLNERRVEKEGIQHRFGKYKNTKIQLTDKYKYTGLVVSSPTKTLSS